MTAQTHDGLVEVPPRPVPTTMRYRLDLALLDGQVATFRGYGGAAQTEVQFSMEDWVAMGRPGTIEAEVSGR